MKNIFISSVFGLILILTISCKSQENDFFRPRMPDKTDTIYYRFYNGVQMIEVDNLDFYDRKIFYLEQTSPRAMPYSMLEPPPRPNIYLFRDSSGMIIKAFNTTLSLAELNKYFSKIPINQKSTSFIRQFDNTHKGKSLFANGVWPYSPNRAFFFNGYYKVVDFNKRREQKQNAGYYITLESYPAGLIDSLGNMVIPMEFDEILPAGNLLIICKNSKWGIIDKSGTEILKPEYEEFSYKTPTITTFMIGDKIGAIFDIEKAKVKKRVRLDEIFFNDQCPNALIPYLQDNHYGFFDQNFEIITDPIYDFCDLFVRSGGNLRRVFRGGKWGFADSTGSEIIPCIYDDAEPFYDKDITTVQRGTTFLSIDNQGEIKEKGDVQIMKRQRTNDPGIVRRSQEHGVVSLSDEVIIPLIYDKVNKYPQEPYFRVYKNEKTGICSLDGKLLLPCTYDEIDLLSGNYPLIRVKKEGRYGFINPRLKQIIPCVYEAVSIEDNGTFLFNINGKWGLADTNNQVIIDAKYDQIYGFSGSNQSLVRQDSLLGFIDSKGIIIIPIRYHMLGASILNNRVMYYEKGLYGFLDSNGKVAIPAQFDRVNNFEKNICGVCKNGRWYLINPNGEKINHEIYDFIDFSWLGNKYLKVMKNKHYGILDDKGTIVYPCEYDEINGYSRSLGFPVKKDGQVFRIPDPAQ